MQGGVHDDMINATIRHDTSHSRQQRNITLAVANKDLLPALSDVKY
jgi:hypothetical protein